MGASMEGVDGVGERAGGVAANEGNPVSARVESRLVRCLLSSLVLSWKRASRETVRVEYGEVDLEGTTDDDREENGVW